MVVILFHFFLVLSAATVGLGSAVPDQDDCQPRKCKHGEPPVRYPFRLKGRQTDHCGSNGFDLSCNNKNQTVLELPKSVKLLVKRIDYVHQKIQVYDEDGCVQNQLQNLTISASPFNLSSVYDNELRNYTLFRCSEQDQSDYYYYSIPCLRTEPDFYVKFENSDSPNGDLLNCTKTKDILEVPEGMISDRSNNFYFSWTKPDCGSCEGRGQGCRPNNTNPLGIECYILSEHIGMFHVILSTINSLI